MSKITKCIRFNEEIELEEPIDIPEEMKNEDIPFYVIHMMNERIKELKETIKQLGG